MTREKSRKLWQMRNLCKQLFPEDSIGITMVRVLEMLVESPDSELAYKSERVQVNLLDILIPFFLYQLHLNPMLILFVLLFL